MKQNTPSFVEMPIVGYNFPENNPNPFEINSENEFFINSSAGFSNSTNDLNDFNYETLIKIPMGYVANIFQKICFVNAGAIIKKWDFEKIDDKHKIRGRFLLFTNKSQNAHLNSRTKSYVVQRYKEQSVIRGSGRRSKKGFVISEVNGVNCYVSRIL